MIIIKIYVAHSKDIDYINDLYNAIEESNRLKDYEFCFPHKNNFENYNDYTFYKKFDLIIAEVSEPSTGMGIELGWANVLKVPIICIYKKGKEVSCSLKTLTDTFIEYNTTLDMINKIVDYLKELDN